MRHSSVTGVTKYILAAISAACTLAMAGLSVRAAEPVLVSGTDWSGLYAGVHLGVGQAAGGGTEAWNWLTNYPTGTLVGVNGGPLTALTAPASFANGFGNRAAYSSTGVLGGVQAGYNWQSGRLVVGIEGDFSGSSQSDKRSYSAQPVAGIFPPLPNFFFIPGSTQSWTSQESIDWLTTWRARVGLAQNDMLLYVTGGGAAGQITTKYTLLSSPGFNGAPVGTGSQWGLPGGIAGGSFGKTKFGWTLGAGVETTALVDLLGLGPNWSAKLEYLYVDLGSVTARIATGLVPVCNATCAAPVTGSTAFTGTSHVTDQIIRLGLNYKFDLLSPGQTRTAAPVLASGTDWSGLYAGVHLGVGRGTGRGSEAWNWLTNYPAGSLVGVNGGLLAALPAATSFNTSFGNRTSYSSTGVLGGVQAGYNWQFGRLVVGLEGDFSGSNQSDKRSYTAQPVPSIFPPLPNFFFVPGSIQGWTSQESIDWLTTWRARVGLAQNDLLLYVTGGGAVGQINTQYTLLSSPGVSGAPTGTGSQWGLPGGIAGGSFGKTKLGWTLGAGVETTALMNVLGLGPNWSAKLEYLYVDLGSVSARIATGLVPVCSVTCAAPATGSTAFTATSHVTDQIVRLGLNYKFDLLAPRSVTAH